MSLRFAYKHLLVRRPIWTLQGRRLWPIPLITVTLVGPTGTAVRAALLDTGATDTVFPESIAATAGIDLSAAPAGEASGVGRVAVRIRYAEVTLRLTDGLEYRQWPARVGFTSAPLHWPLLGFAGCLQFFDATFRGGLEEVELMVNGLYPGT